MGNDETEFWREVHATQQVRRDKREREFIGNLPQFEAAIRGMGFTLHTPGEYHYQIKKNGKLIADYWPRPHHRYRIGKKYRNAKHPGGFLVALMKVKDA